MLFKGKTIIEYVIEQLQPAVNKMTIVSNNPEYEKFGFAVIADLIKETGPGGGIYTALNHTDTDLNFIVSCDMPFISKEAIGYMFKNKGKSQIILPVRQGKMEPLFGIYSKDCLFKWHELMEGAISKLQEMVFHFKLNKIDVDNNVLFSDSFFMNINTKKDFEYAFNLI
jgi:molybdopterin-guanine dinucleotide biosynthesis protein A